MNRIDARGQAAASAALEQVERLREEWPKVRDPLGVRVDVALLYKDASIRSHIRRPP